MKEAALVFLGGGLGSVVRYLLGKWIGGLHEHYFPFGTLVINIVACIALGFIVGAADHRQVMGPYARLFWTVGVCGGFSTFSTFSMETWTMMQNGFTLSALGYVVISLLLGIGAIAAGLFLGEAYS